jgi:hypothetical protein
MSASLPLSCGRRSVRAFGASGPLDRLAEVTPEPSIGSPYSAGAGIPSGRSHVGDRRPRGQCRSGAEQSDRDDCDAVGTAVGMGAGGEHGTAEEVVTELVA